MKCRTPSKFYVQQLDYEDEPIFDLATVEEDLDAAIEDWWDQGLWRGQDRW